MAFSQVGLIFKPRNSKNKKEVKRLDGAGRIGLGKFRAGMQYEVNETQDGTITLTPMVIIPARELWLHENLAAKKSVLRGLKQSSKGERVSLGSFAEYLGDDDEN